MMHFHDVLGCIGVNPKVQMVSVRIATGIGRCLEYSSLQANVRG